MHTAMLSRLCIITATSFVAACSDRTPLNPSRTALSANTTARLSDETQNPALQQALATMRAVTAQYHDVQNALNDGFVLRHTCGVQGDDGPIGTVYANRSRVQDGAIDPWLPDGLIYEPTSDGLRLVGVELAMPYALWTNPDPPTFFGHAFQREDGFKVYGLHVWIWLHNPNGMFDETNPNVQC